MGTFSGNIQSISGDRKKQTKAWLSTSIPLVGLKLKYSTTSQAGSRKAPSNCGIVSREFK